MSIHDRFKEDRKSGSVGSFFKALASGTTASGLGRRVYDAAEKGSGTEHRQTQQAWQAAAAQQGHGGTGAKPAPPQLPTINNASDVERALAPNQQHFDPNYASAVLQAFVRQQLETGADEKSVEGELDELERRLPDYAHVGVFRHVRDTYRLGSGLPPAFSQH
ncbi:hypothetical protein Q8F55_008215 [Vanrija albida]|uniref:Uncharacterized protein n=1 Tax=Vanrija albida TaxID=181172 RepID=A0ABR3PVN3_9TREE